MPLTLSDPVIARIREASEYISEMQRERLGYGRLGESEVIDTAMSLVRALPMLLDADEVWVDGPSGLHFGGRTGGIYFGLIGHKAGNSEFAHPPIRWAFHS